MDKWAGHTFSKVLLSFKTFASGSTGDDSLPLPGPGVEFTSFLLRRHLFSKYLSFDQQNIQISISISSCPFGLNRILPLLPPRKKAKMDTLDCLRGW